MGVLTCRLRPVQSCPPLVSVACRTAQALSCLLTSHISQDGNGLYLDLFG